MVVNCRRAESLKCKCQRTPFKLAVLPTTGALGIWMSRRDTPNQRECREKLQKACGLHSERNDAQTAENSAIYGAVDGRFTRPECPAPQVSSSDLLEGSYFRLPEKVNFREDAVIGS